MSDDAKKSVISSLKELESMPTADTGEQQTARVAKSAARPNAPKTQALNLLSGILDETAAEAEAEAQALELELKRKKEAAEAQARAEKERKERELQERVLQEERRLREMEELRRKQEEVMRIEQLKAEGKWVEPEPPKPQIQPSRPVMTTQEVLAVQAKEKRGRMLVLAASIVLMLGIGGGAFWFISQQEFVDGASAHPKVAAEVVMMADAVADIAFNPIPERAVPEAVEETSGSATRARPRPRPAATSSEPQRPQIQLGGRIGGRE